MVLFGNDRNAPDRTIRVRRMIPHPDFAGAAQINDLALLILDENVESIQPARIAGSDDIDAANWVRMVGLGHTATAASIPAGIKRMVDVPLASSSYSYTRQGRAFATSPERELVAGRPALGRDSCSIDSGDPCFVRVENRWRLCGVVARPILSYNYPCGDGSVIARIDHYMPWMRSLPGVKW